MGGLPFAPNPKSVRVSGLRAKPTDVILGYHFPSGFILEMVSGLTEPVRG